MRSSNEEEKKRNKTQNCLLNKYLSVCGINHMNRTMTSNHSSSSGSSSSSTNPVHVGEERLMVNQQIVSRCSGEMLMGMFSMIV